MCNPRQLCDATRAAWNAHPGVTDVFDLHAIGMEAARRNNDDVFILEAHLSETVLFHAQQEVDARLATHA